MRNNSSLVKCKIVKYNQLVEKQLIEAKSHPDLSPCAVHRLAVNTLGFARALSWRWHTLQGEKNESHGKNNRRSVGRVFVSGLQRVAVQC
jgi:hypothetical protein